MHVVKDIKFPQQTSVNIVDLCSKITWCKNLNKITLEETVEDPEKVLLVVPVPVVPENVVKGAIMPLINRRVINVY